MEKLDRFYMPKRAMDGNKGTFGHIIVYGGCENYLGAPILSGKAAYRTGCGLVEMMVPEIVRNCCAAALPEAIWSCDAFEEDRLPRGKQTLIVGPGLGNNQQRAEKLQKVLNDACESRTLTGCVIDADALNILSTLNDRISLIPNNSVMTPHPGEMGRLFQTNAAEVQNNRRYFAERLSNLYKCTVLLKGAHTLIAGANEETVELSYATSALAKAGSGDVLSGIIAGLIAQEMSPFDAAVLGAILHAEAGIAAARSIGCEQSVSASDLINFLPIAIQKKVRPENSSYLPALTR